MESTTASVCGACRSYLLSKHEITSLSMNPLPRLSPPLPSLFAVLTRILVSFTRISVKLIRLSVKLLAYS
jgi:hypothetical protein